MIDPHKELRNEMVLEQIEYRGVKDSAALSAMKKVPRHKFMPEVNPETAYGDFPIPIGNGQTISQPYIVGLMTELLEITKESRILEIGTGSGYQTAVLAETAKEVFTIERISDLAEKSRKILDQMGYKNIRFRCGNGYKGWPEEAPFDGILVTAAPEVIPPALLEQLGAGGRLVIPVGGMFEQALKILKKESVHIDEKIVCGVRFVKLVDEE